MHHNPVVIRLNRFRFFPLQAIGIDTMDDFNLVSFCHQQTSE